MNNYEYIVASLPALQLEDDRSDNLVVQELVDEIRGQLSERDAAVLDVLLSGYDDNRLDADFYRAALKRQPLHPRLVPLRPGPAQHHRLLPQRLARAS